MTFRKSCFFKALFACIIALVFCDPVFATCRTSGACGGTSPDACAGYLCHHGLAYPCREGCYCLGGRSTATAQNIQTKCRNHENPGLEEFGIYLCPSGYTSVDPADDTPGAKSITDCYKYNTSTNTDFTCPNGGRLYYAADVCSAGRYMPKRGSSCSVCPAGSFCHGRGTQSNPVIASCEDQGIDGHCTDQYYSNAGAAECSECFLGQHITKNSSGYNIACDDCGKGYICPNLQEKHQCTGNTYSDSDTATECKPCTTPGFVIKKTNGLNTGCIRCSVGTFATSDGECESCPRGYRCSGGRAYKCVGNQYSDTEESTTCLSCGGPGMGVVTEISNGEELHVGCDICDSGKYADQGVCKTCPAGHHCSEGIDLGLCGSGSCAASSGSNACVTSGADTCKTCPEDWFSNDDRTACLSCADVIMPPFNEDLYQQATVRGLGGESMCGIKLAGATKCQVGQDEDGSNVVWYIVNGAWRLGANTAIVDRHSYVKSPAPDSPVGDDADWCAECPAETYNLSGGRGAGACKKCSAGYCIYDNDCLPCKPGYYCPGTDGAANDCSTHDGDYGIESEGYKCEKGTFSGAGQASCRSCGEGYTTDGVGTAFVDDGETEIGQICVKIPLKLKKNITDAEPVVLPANVLKEKGRVNRSVIRKNN